jgi:hypothetical protein
MFCPHRLIVVPKRIIIIPNRLIFVPDQGSKMQNYDVGLSLYNL